MKFLINFVFLVILWHQGQCVLHLATIFHDHMVLQRGPQQAVIWGTAATEGSTVTVTLQQAGQSSSSAVTTTVAGGKWKVKLPAQTSTAAYTVTVASPSEGTVTLHDVLFGDVWLCSGQSNMQFTLNHVINATEELALAHQFPNIRFTRARLVENPHPQDTMAFDIPWTGPSNSNALAQSSAVCWLFAQYLYPKVNHPIGLIESSWGGTPIEAWSPPEVFTACAPAGKRAPGDHSVLWNAMIHPLLSYTIYGALWYQGESNAGRANQYSCLIQNMIKQWRTQFHQQSLLQTSDQFSFGYVQLAGYVNDTNAVGAFPAERWAQTANYGYSPNPALPNTFMAVAMDLPDFSSPYGNIHPRYKQDVAERLVLGALNVAYGQTSVDFLGAFPSAITLDPQTHHVTVVYDQGHATLNIRSNNGFEVCCTSTTRSNCDDAHDHWVAAPILAHDASSVTLDASRCAALHAVGVRYEWRTSPCLYKHCAVYDLGSGLPAPPYITHTLRAIQGPELVG